MREISSTTKNMASAYSDFQTEEYMKEAGKMANNMAEAYTNARIS